MKLQLLSSNEEFHFLHNGVNVITQSRKHNRLFCPKDGIFKDSLGPLDSEGNSDVKALLRWPFRGLHCMGIVNIRKLQLI